jgi:hypothetical protein
MTYHDIQAKHLQIGDHISLGIRGTFQIISIDTSNKTKLIFKLANLNNPEYITVYEVPQRSYLWSLKNKKLIFKK